jgi:hypothetical protein
MTDYLGRYLSRSQFHQFLRNGNFYRETTWFAQLISFMLTSGNRACQPHNPADTSLHVYLWLQYQLGTRSHIYSMRKFFELIGIPTYASLINAAGLRRNLTSSSQSTRWNPIPDPPLNLKPKSQSIPHLPTVSHCKMRSIHNLLQSWYESPDSWMDVHIRSPDLIRNRKIRSRKTQWHIRLLARSMRIAWFRVSRLFCRIDQPIASQDA